MITNLYNGLVDIYEDEVPEDDDGYIFESIDADVISQDGIEGEACSMEKSLHWMMGRKVMEPTGRSSSEQMERQDRSSEIFRAIDKETRSTSPTKKSESSNGKATRYVHTMTDHRLSMVPKKRASERLVSEQAEEVQVQEAAPSRSSKKVKRAHRKNRIFLSADHCCHS